MLVCVCDDALYVDDTHTHIPQTGVTEASRLATARHKPWDKISSKVSYSGRQQQPPNVLRYQPARPPPPPAARDVNIHDGICVIHREVTSLCMHVHDANMPGDVCLSIVRRKARII